MTTAQGGIGIAMSKFKAGDVVLNKKTGAVHFYLDTDRFVHLVCPVGDTWECGVWELYDAKGPDYSDQERELIFNLSEGIARYLKYDKLVIFEG